MRRSLEPGLLMLRSESSLLILPLLSRNQAEDCISAYSTTDLIQQRESYLYHYGPEARIWLDSSGALLGVRPFSQTNRLELDMAKQPRRLRAI